MSICPMVMPTSSVPGTVLGIDVRCTQGTDRVLKVYMVFWEYSVYGINNVVCARQRKFRILRKHIELKGRRQGAFLEPKLRGEAKKE